MYLKTLLTTILTLSLLSFSACSKEAEKELKDTNNNIQKIAAQPIITFPAENAEVTENTVVRVDVDESVEYTSLELLVDGESIAKDFEAPFEFNWDISIFTESGDHSLLIKAVTTEEVLLRSNSHAVKIVLPLPNKIDEPIDTIKENSESTTSTFNNPLITFPAQNATIDAQTAIRVDLDNKAEYTTVELLIDGEVVATKTEAPFEFNWDAYFWSETAAHSIIIKAITKEEDVLRSEPTTITIDPSINKSLTMLSPSKGLSLSNVNTTALIVDTIPNATTYEYQISSEATFSDATTQSFDPLNTELILDHIGEYFIHFRATNDKGYKGLWSDTTTFSLTQPNAPLLNKTVATENNGAFDISLNWYWDQAEGNFTVEIAEDKAFNTIVQTKTLSNDRLSTTVEQGVFYWRVSATNNLGQVSSVSQTSEFSAGMIFFEVDNLTNIKIFAENDGIIYLGKSKNTLEVNKIDSSGSVIWSFTWNDKTIYSIDSFKNGKNGYYVNLTTLNNDYKDSTILKISKDGLKTFEKTFSTSNVNTHIYDFVELDSEEVV
jgi:hypothetical protein